MDPHLEKLQREISTALASLSPEQLSRHSDGNWCAGEILEHLYLSYTGTTKGFQRLAEAGKPNVMAPNWRQRAGRLLVVNLGYFPSGRTSPQSARPRGLPAEKVCAEIATKIGEMDAMIGQVEKQLGSGKLLDHPILGPLTGAEWRKFHLVHGRHHLKQIRKLQV
jgi:Protein of unknown function (DUF1569)